MRAVKSRESSGEFHLASYCTFINEIILRYVIFYDANKLVIHSFIHSRIIAHTGHQRSVSHNSAVRSQGQYWIEYLYLLLATPHTNMAAANCVVITNGGGLLEQPISTTCFLSASCDWL